MSRHKQTISDDLGRLADDARHLVSDTVGVAGETARKQLAVAIDNSKEIYDRAHQKAVKGAKAADHVIRENPYRTIGVAWGIGVVIGFLLARRN